jgi:hypothetical protein
MDTLNTVSIMVFFISPEGNIFLKNDSGYWGTYFFPSNTSETVSIREMICCEFESQGISISSRKLRYLQNFDDEGNSIFVYFYQLDYELTPCDTKSNFFSISEFPSPDIMHALESHLLPGVLESAMPV